MSEALVNAPRPGQMKVTPRFDATAKRTLHELLRRHREELVDRGTDWVREQSIDLKGGRPREQTRVLVERVVRTQSMALLEGDSHPLDEFIDFVTSFRASGEFHVSTVLRGMTSFRVALSELLRREIDDPRLAAAVLSAVDGVAQQAVFRAADIYSEKLNQTIVHRRAALESELAELTAAKELELDEKIRTIDAQRAMLSTLSSPIIDVWEGILVVPLIGEIDPDRAEEVRERVLAEIVDSKASVVLIDITGLSVADERLAAELVRLFGAVRLHGAEAMLVGVSPAGALALASLPTSLSQVHSFSTLHDGLRAAFLRTGLRVVRSPG